MPCRDNFTYDNYDSGAREKADEAVRKAEMALHKVEKQKGQFMEALESIIAEKHFYKERLDQVTSHLCFVMHAITKYHPETLRYVFNKQGLKEWWEEHQKMDQERENS